MKGEDPRDPDVPLRRRLLALPISDVLTTVASYYDVEQRAFHSRQGGRPRAVAAWLARRYTEATLQEMCRPFGLSHPGSISNLTRKIDREQQVSTRLRHDLAAIEKRLSEI